MFFFSFFRRFKFLFAACLGYVSLVAPSYADLSINPYPLSEKSVGVSERMIVAPDQKFSDKAMFEASQEPVSVLQPQSQPVYIPETESPTISSNTWSAFRGADLHEVLEMWSRARGVSLIWNITERYTVRDTVTVEDSYEMAVSSLLSQYDHLYVRPVGSLHVSPDGQGQALVVFSYEGS